MRWFLAAETQILSFCSSIPFSDGEGEWEAVSSNAFRHLRSASLVVSAGKGFLLCMKDSFLRRAKLPLSVPSQEPVTPLYG